MSQVFCLQAGELAATSVWCSLFSNVCDSAGMSASVFLSVSLADLVGLQSCWSCLLEVKKKKGLTKCHWAECAYGEQERKRKDFAQAELMLDYRRLCERVQTLEKWKNTPHCHITSRHREVWTQSHTWSSLHSLNCCCTETQLFTVRSKLRHAPINPLFQQEEKCSYSIVDAKLNWLEVLYKAPFKKQGLLQSKHENPKRKKGRGSPLFPVECNCWGPTVPA